MTMAATKNFNDDNNNNNNTAVLYTNLVTTRLRGTPRKRWKDRQTDRQTGR
jgi:hypothetical protein